MLRGKCEAFQVKSKKVKVKRFAIPGSRLGRVENGIMEDWNDGRLEER
jgi:hypothetical protein